MTTSTTAWTSLGTTELGGMVWYSEGRALLGDVNGPGLTQLHYCLLSLYLISFHSAGLINPGPPDSSCSIRSVLAPYFLQNLSQSRVDSLDVPCASHLCSLPLPILT